jgi:hypothetical protein
MRGITIGCIRVKQVPPLPGLWGHDPIKLNFEGLKYVYPMISANKRAVNILSDGRLFLVEHVKNKGLYQWILILHQQAAVELFGLPRVPFAQFERGTIMTCLNQRVNLGTQTIFRSTGDTRNDAVGVVISDQTLVYYDGWLDRTAAKLMLLISLDVVPREVILMLGMYTFGN